MPRDRRLLSDAIETILGHRFPRPELLREALTHRLCLAGPWPHARLQRAAGIRRRPGAGPADGGVARRAVPARAGGGPWAAAGVSGVAAGAGRGRGGDRPGRPAVGGAGRGAGRGEAPRHGAGGCAWRRRSGRSITTPAWMPRARVVRRAWDAAMVAQVDPPKDAKTTLQEWAQKHTRDLPVYRVVARSGPPHAPEFAVAVQVGGAQGTGTAGSKRRGRAIRRRGPVAVDGQGKAPRPLRRRPAVPAAARERLRVGSRTAEAAPAASST